MILKAHQVNIQVQLNLETFPESRSFTVALTVILIHAPAQPFKSHLFHMIY